MTALNTQTRSNTASNAGTYPAPSEAHQRAVGGKTRKISERQKAIQREALNNAESNSSESNYDAIFEGFIDKGIDPDDICPRENVFTFNAWKAKGRVVCKGETGVKIKTWIPCKKTDKETGEIETYRRPKITSVFHVSQTKSLTPDNDNE